MIVAGDVRDPYDFFFGEILRIPPGNRQPDHYTLLGLAFFEPSVERIKRAGHDRKAALRAVPAGDPGLEHVRADLIQRVRAARRALLDRDAREAYDAILIDGGADGVASSDSEFVLREGTEFDGRFRILGVERRGAFGRVFSALDSREGGRCELTVLPPAAAHDRSRRRRAEKALRRLSSLDHPSIEPLTGTGEAEGLLVGRWAVPPGTSLLRHVQRQPHSRLDADEAARIAAAIADALIYAHERGALHGDLHPRNIFVEPDGSVRLTEFGLAAGAQPPKQVPSSVYTAPERELSPKADAYALGAVAYFMLAGEAPFLDGGRALVPKPLPDETPAPLAAAVLGLLGREPGHRPDTIHIPVPAVSARAPLRVTPARLGAIGLAAVVIVGILLSRGFAPPLSGDDTPAGRAWKLIEERRFADAITLLERERAANAKDQTLTAPLASALEGSAAAAEKNGDPYLAQRMLERAELLEHAAGRARQLERVRALARRRLEAVKVTASPVARDAVVHVAVGDASIEKLVVAGRDHSPDAPIPLSLEPGDRTIEFVIVDRAGNRLVGSLSIAIDRSAPELSVVEPNDGAMLRDGSVRVRVLVEDAHAPKDITIHGRRVRVEEGVATTTLSLNNGVHKIAIVAEDGAGNRAETAVSLTIDDRAPTIVMERMRFVTRDGRVVVRGRTTRDSKLVLDGEAVEIDAEGLFAVGIDVRKDRVVTLVATGPTGVTRTASVRAVIDGEPPRVKFGWKRLDPQGRLLYGTREMDARAVEVPVRVTDKTQVEFFPTEGRVKDGVWRLPPHEGERRVELRVRDEAGNETLERLRLSGHRATPRLDVKTRVGEVTRAAKAAFDIDADHTLFFNGEPIEPGRIERTLEEGDVEFEVRAVDPYGNESTWHRRVRVDRTPPTLKVAGPLERGIGKQKVTIEADESLASITCLSQTQEDTGKSATFEQFLEVGRTHLHVIARDLAGNVRKAKLELRVVNHVLLLDGESAVRVPILARLRDFTIEFWARGAPAVDPAVMLSRGMERAYQIVWSSGDEALPHILVDFTNSGLTTIIAKKLRDPLEWHHYALIHDNKKLRFYIDGRQQGYLDAVEAITPGTLDLLIGAAAVTEGGGVESGLVGRIDELRLSEGVRYARAFTPARFFRVDARTRLMLRFDGVVDGKFPDVSKSTRNGVAIGKPKLLIAE